MLRVKNLLYLLLLLPAIAWVVFLPEIKSWAWHATHRNPVEHYGWEVTVPEEWFAERSEEVIYIGRLPRLHWRNKESYIRFVPLNALSKVPHDEHIWKQVYNEERWNRQETGFLKVRDYEVVDRPYIPAAGSEAYCVEGVHAMERSWRALQCVHFGKRLLISFQGKQEYLPQFYRVARQLREATRDSAR